MHQNVTISLPEDVLREAKHMAVDRGVSLSKLVAGLVQERVEAHREYEQARVRHLKMLAEGRSLGASGVITWSRDGLHER